jgi:hypothetical protein
MAEIQEQREVAQEITDLISNPMGMDSVDVRALVPLYRFPTELVHAAGVARG